MELDALFPFVMPQAKGCPPQTAIHHIRQALIRFCERSLAWRVDLAPVQRVIGREQYPVVLPDDAQLVKLLAVSLKDAPLDILGATGAARNQSGSSAGQAWIKGLRTLCVSNLAPFVAGDQLEATAAIKPGQSADSIDPDLFEQFAAVVSKGALGTLLEMGDVSWSNPGRAQLLKGEFESETHRAGRRVENAFGRSGRSTRRVRPFTR